MYKNLNLDRKYLLEDIKDYLNDNKKEYAISENIKKIDNIRHRVEIKIEGNKFNLDFHFKQNGTTTIEVNTGNIQTKTIKKEIAEYIINSGDSVIGKKINKKSDQFIIKNIEDESLTAILDILEEEGFIKNIEKRNKLDLKTIVLKGPQDDQVTISHYKSGKLMVQGKQLILYHELFTYLTALLDKNDITSLYNEQYNLDLELNSHDELLDEYLPNAAKHVNFHPLNKFIIQSIYNLHLKSTNVICYDGHIVPATKALEGFIKIILHNEYFIEIPKDSLPEFKKMGNYYELNINDSNKINNSKVTDYINECYNYYRNNRHSTLHYDSPTKMFEYGEATKILSNQSESNRVIKEILKKIDKYYTLW